MNMFWVSFIGIVVLFLLVVLLGPALWSSRLSLTEEQKELERRSKQKK
jgi:hypothetical protein